MSYIPGSRRRRATFRVQLRAMMRPYLAASLGFGVMSNLLLMASPIYTTRVYDRVMVSGPLETVVWLGAIAAFFLAIFAAAETGRRRVLSLAGARLEADLTRRVFAKYEASGNFSSVDVDLARVSRVTKLFTNNTLCPLFDILFVPLFVAMLFVVHPLLGWFALAGSITVLAVALVAEGLKREASERAADIRQQAELLIASMQRQRPAVVSMGMIGGLLARYGAMRGEADILALKASGQNGGLSVSMQSLRQVLPILLLGLGAALALSQDISAGTIVATAIVLARALAPVDQIVGSWQILTRGRQSWQTLKQDLEALAGTTAQSTALPRPAPSLTINLLSVAAPGSDKPLVHPFSLKVDSGALICVVGPNGCGKTTLLQTLAGTLSPREGSVRLGASDLHAWAQVDRGRFIGFLPQHAEMFPGTVRDNLARFGSVPDRVVFNALECAGATDLVFSLPQGMDTKIGVGGLELSSGQTQMIALARAVLGQPVLLLLDEPTAHLDPATTARLIDSLREVAKQGCIVVAATHDNRLLQASDSILRIHEGSVSHSSPNDLLAGDRGVQLRVAASSGESRS